MAGSKEHLYIDMKDDVVRGSIILDKGNLMWPPPPISVQAATPPPPAAAVVKHQVKAEVDHFRERCKEVTLYSAGNY